MADFITLLSPLADGRPHSVGELAGRAGVSVGEARAQLELLLAEGMTLAREGDSVVWRNPRPLLRASEVEANCEASTRERFGPISVLAEVDSTSSWLIRQREGASGEVCVAERQTSGRGRRGNRWFAAPCASLCFSLRWRFDAPPADLAGLSLGVGMAVAETLRREFSLPVGVKWPNDLYLHGAKLGGILVELPRSSAHHSEAIIGIGLNVALEDLDDSDYRWTSLHHHLPPDAPIDRNRLLARLLDGLARLLPGFVDDGSAWVQRHWAEYDVTRDRQVTIQRDEEMLRGIGAGIDEAFRFVLQGADNSRRFHSGEVSLRAG